MIALGPTSDFIVAGFLAVSQLIAPVPDQAASEAERAIRSHSACQKSVEKADDSRCTSDKEALRVLGFRPKPLSEYLKLPNDQLVEQLHLLCLVIQDRVFLDATDWMQGKMAARDELPNRLIILQKPDLQDTAAKVVQEAADGQFQTAVAYKVLMALCHEKIDRTALAKQVDFTGGIKYLQSLMSEMPSVDQLPDLPQASFVYDNKGQRIGEIFDEEFISRNGHRYLGQKHRRRVVNASQIPPLLADAFIAVEDKRFRIHKGFDFEAIRRLIFGGMSGAQEGGSTLTMQLVKNVFFDQDIEQERAKGKRTIKRKLKEILMLPVVEAHYSKEEILTYYLNLINMTSNAQGVKMAAMDLFGKDDLYQLTVDEMALLAAMPKGASEFNPRVHPQDAKARRDLVLDMMQTQGYISVKDTSRYKMTPIQLSDPSHDEMARALSYYFVGHLTNYFLDLKRNNMSDPRWTMGGFEIKTALNLDLQEAMTQALQKGLLDFEKTAGRYKWKPWLDSEGHTLNIQARVQAGKSPGDILKALETENPDPELGWKIATKISGAAGKWALANGFANVTAQDYARFRSLKDYDVVLLSPSAEANSKKPPTLQLASTTKVEGAAVMMDIETGDVLALSGGFSAGPHGQFAQNNRATVSVRQIGSAIKPFIYLYALKEGVKPDAILSDYPVRFPMIKNCPYRWEPGNYEGEGGRGENIPMQVALQKSINRAALSLFMTVADVPFNRHGFSDLGNAPPPVVKRLTDTLYGIYDFASSFGVYPDREALTASGYKGPCLPFLLGAQETSALHMAEGYAAIGNGGLKRQAVFIREALQDNQPLVIDQSATLREQAEQYRLALKMGVARAPEAFGAIPGVSPMAVATIRHLMQGVLRNGTAAHLKRWADIMAGKTGTTNNSKDVWFIGFTAKVVLAVHVGYDSDKEYADLNHGTGASLAVPIFESIMNAYYQMHPDELNLALPQPATIYKLDDPAF